MLILPYWVLNDIKKHAIEGYPHEIVGVLAGTFEGENKNIQRVFRGTNQFKMAAESSTGAHESLKADLDVDGTSENRYFMTGEEMQQIDAACRASKLDILGFYHTHPDHPARPSVTDLRFAQQTLPGYSYVILAVENGQPAEMTSWVLSEDERQFDEETITDGP